MLFCGVFYPQSCIWAMSHVLCSTDGTCLNKWQYWDMTSLCMPCPLTGNTLKGVVITEASLVPFLSQHIHSYISGESTSNTHPLLIHAKQWSLPYIPVLPSCTLQSFSFIIIYANHIKKSFTFHPSNHSSPLPLLLSKRSVVHIFITFSTWPTPHATLNSLSSACIDYCCASVHVPYTNFS